MLKLDASSVMLTMALFIAVDANQIRSSKQASQTSITYLTLNGNHNNVTYTFAKPVVKLFGDHNKISTSINFNPDTSLSRESAKTLWLSQQRASRDQPKYFYVSKYIKDTWMRAHVHCAVQNMKLATFDSPHQLEKVVGDLKNARSSQAEELWISAVRDLTPFGPNFLYFPTLVPFTPNANIKPGTVSGTMTCVYLKLMGGADARTTLNTGDCASPSESRFVLCESYSPIPPDLLQFLKI